MLELAGKLSIDKSRPRRIRHRRTMMKSKVVLFTLTLALTAVAALLIAPVDAVAGDMDGKALFTDTHNCGMCHAVPAAEIESKTKSEKMKGPELGGKVEAEFDKLAAYMRKAGELDGESHKKEFKGTDEELQAIIDWLGSLEAKE
jgi:mono/diheme cytochrome c family protein